MRSSPPPTATGAGARYVVAARRRRRASISGRRRRLAHEPPLVPALTVASLAHEGRAPGARRCRSSPSSASTGSCSCEAARSVVRWDDDREAATRSTGCAGSRARPARSRRRARLPVVDGPVRAGRARRPPRPRGRRPRRRRRRRSSRAPARTGEWVVAVGPEGGFDRRRAGALRRRAPRSAVGPFVLRAETAAIAAAAALAGRRSPVASSDAMEPYLARRVATAESSDKCRPRR